MIYHAEKVTGLIYSFPFALFSLAAGAVSLRLIRNFPAGSGRQEADDRDLLGWLCLSMAGVTLLSFGFLLVFRYASMRYLTDIVPPLLVLSLCGFWEGYRVLEGRPLLRRLYLVLAFSLASVSILVSGLLGVAGYSS
jgi:hypothetical protein